MGRSYVTASSTIAARQVDHTSPLWYPCCMIYLLVHAVKTGVWGVRRCRPKKGVDHVPQMVDHTPQVR
eukprot:5662710-Amphidinium_carterae.1